LPPSHRSLIESIENSPIATVVSDPSKPDNPLTVVNRPFCALTGYGEAEILGRNCRFLAGRDTDRRLSDVIRGAIGQVRPVLVEILNYRKDGSPFLNGVMITPLFDDDEKLQYFLGSQVDLGPADALAIRRTAAAARVSTLSLRQKQVLRAMTDGLLNKQIAHKLGIAEKTVKMHRALMLDRLGTATSADAIRLAVEAGL
jgi:hypothetical protein